MGISGVCRQIYEEIKKSKKVLLSLHFNPDLDSLCSNYAMQSFLKDSSKDCVVINPGKGLPDNYSLFDTSFITNTDPASFDSSPFDLFIGLDSPDESFFAGVKGFKFNSNFPRINIDHHETSDWGDVRLILPKRLSTTSILYSFFSQVGYKPDLSTKNALALGYLSDSGVFGHGVNEDDLRFMTDMLRGGVDVNRLIWFKEFNTPYQDFLTKAKVLQNVVFDKRLNVAWSQLTLKEAEELKPVPSDTGSHIKEVEFFKDIKGIKCAVMFKEKDKGFVSVSLRSNQLGYDVSKVAEMFGGGGHVRSAGFILRDMPLSKAIGKVLKVFETN